MVEPIDLPSAAGADFGEGDVRHFSEGDGVSVPGLSNPTRQLARRDSIIASKLNAVITELNNKEQIVPLPIYRVVLPPSSEEVVANHRIPNGYEARVLNGAISATPVSADVELNIMWAVGFGNVAGQSVFTTSAEGSGGTTFSPAGEFIISIKNKGATTLDVVASVFITMRPLTAVSGALLPAATVPPPGPPGPKGDKGDVGGPGSAGPAGSPGLLNRGAWTVSPFPVQFNANDVVVNDFRGTSGASSYVCLQTHIANGINEPNPTLVPSPFWRFVAQAGQRGPTGSSSGISSAYVTQTIAGTYATGSNYVAGGSSNGYVGGGSPSSNIGNKFSWVESTVITPTVGGLALLQAQLKLAFAGDVTIPLPSIAANGASTNWTTDRTVVTAVPHQFNYYGTGAAIFFTTGTNSVTVSVPGTLATPVGITITGQTGL